MLASSTGKYLKYVDADEGYPWACRFYGIAMRTEEHCSLAQDRELAVWHQARRSLSPTITSVKGFLAGRFVVVTTVGGLFEEVGHDDIAMVEDEMKIGQSGERGTGPRP